MVCAKVSLFLLVVFAASSLAWYYQDYSVRIPLIVNNSQTTNKIYEFSVFDLTSYSGYCNADCTNIRLSMIDTNGAEIAWNLFNVSANYTHGTGLAAGWIAPTPNNALYLFTTANSTAGNQTQVVGYAYMNASGVSMWPEYAQLYATDFCNVEGWTNENGGTFQTITPWGGCAFVPAYTLNPIRLTWLDTAHIGGFLTALSYNRTNDYSAGITVGGASSTYYHAYWLDTAGSSQSIEQFRNNNGAGTVGENNTVPLQNATYGFSWYPYPTGTAPLKGWVADFVHNEKELGQVISVNNISSDLTGKFIGFGLGFDKDYWTDVCYVYYPYNKNAYCRLYSYWGKSSTTTGQVETSGAEKGSLCNLNVECASRFCEGSASNEKRCCESQPNADGWSGGGNSYGCGADPSSYEYDYYCDENGNEQFEMLGSKNCDADDSCIKICDANNVLSELDYYVIQNTDTCASVGRNLVEDCLIKESTESDGGNIPLVAGNVFDFEACSNGACIGNTFTDTCQSTTNLLEYYVLSHDVSHQSQNWLCQTFETAAVDAYGDDPSATESCTAGIGAGCASGKFSTNAGTSGMDHCAGTCGVGTNSCQFVEYYPKDSVDACPGLDTCVSKLYDADTNENTCGECNGANRWSLGGETAATTCCGDDSNEFKKTRTCSAGICESNENDQACCTVNSKCVYNSVCYKTLYSGDVDGDSQKETCLNGVWNEVKAAKATPAVASPRPHP